MSRAFAADGKTLLSVFYDEFRSDVPLKDISKNMQNAIIAAEDRQFFQHNGVDFKGVARAFVNNNSGKSQQGVTNDRRDKEPESGGDRVGKSRIANWA